MPFDEFVSVSWGLVLIVVAVLSLIWGAKSRKKASDVYRAKRNDESEGGGHA